VQQMNFFFTGDEVGDIVAGGWEASDQGILEGRRKSVHDITWIDFRDIAIDTFLAVCGGLVKDIGHIEAMY